MSDTEEPAIDVHTWFGGSYSDYAVLHRTLLQSMPVEWQHRFTALMGELEERFEGLPQAKAYHVEPGEWVYVNEAEDPVLHANGVTVLVGPNGTTYYDKEGNELGAADRVFIRGKEPVPHYNRGRTHIEPTAANAEEIAELLKGNPWERKGE
ncbi:hypothetical protein [Actinomadura rubrisoli]|uniref:Uncharacterized protein n=1 Tax=Actinomadura rubrisoli TaxID=2530368 RepID=A0A4V2YZH6_9ACTN|nr:hypothetical protein [Actinomadura rubrisoli]TDD97187.1 hypothetical protein E1298_01760 [Actinomadura rubrisoli]